MFTRVLPVLLLLLVPGTVNIGTVQTSLELKTLDDVADFMQTYYLHLRPEFIGDLIDALRPTGFLQEGTGSAIGFFSEIFAANPNRLPQWQALIAKQDEQTKAVLGRGIVCEQGRKEFSFLMFIRQN